jgi:Mg-chelatase subunit ChlD
MRRILFDVPRWHLIQHREHRDLPLSKEGDRPQQKIEDELFETLYAGECDALAPEEVNAALGSWAKRVHATCEQLPHFARLAADCRGDTAAAALAVETLVAQGAIPDPSEPPPNASPGSRKDPLRRPLQAACVAAASAVEGYREAVDGLTGVVFAPAPGPGGAPERATDLERVKPLLQQLRSDEKLRRIALLAGRFKRITAAKRRQRVRHGADEVTDVEQGADLSRALPAELAKLSHPRLRLHFIRSLVERQVLQYQLVGAEPLGRGPLLVLLDKSTSMDDLGRDEWAAAVTITLLEHARAERRPFGLVVFTDRILHEVLVPAGDALPWDAFSHASEGGTDISLAVERGLNLIASGSAPFRRSDLVLVTDGASDASRGPELRERARALQATILGIAIGMRPDRLAPWCDDFASPTTLTTLDRTLAESLVAA